MGVEFVKVTDEIVQHVAKNMMWDHRVEIMASADLEPIEALTIGVRDSDFSAAGLIDGDPVAIYGLVRGALVGGVGVPWMLGTDGIMASPRAFMSGSRDVVKSMREISPIMSNHVQAGYVKCIRWLIWLGFTVHEPEPYGPYGELFCEFTMGK